MTSSIPSLCLYKGQSWESYLKDLKISTNQLLLDAKDHEDVGNVSLLPRKDITTYRICPKIDVFELVRCNSCNKLLIPSVFKTHREKYHPAKSVKLSTTSTTPSSSTSIKKKSSHNRCKKKTTSSMPPPPLFPKSQTTSSTAIIAAPIETSLQLAPPHLEAEQTVTPKIPSPEPPLHLSSQKITNSKSNSNLSKTSVSKNDSHSKSPSFSSSSSSSSSPSASVSPLPALPPSSSSAASSSATAASLKIPENVSLLVSAVPSSNKHKKSRKNKIPRDVDLDKHCGVVEGNKGPCMRPIKCSYHQTHEKRAVLGRTKSFYQLLTEYKTKDPENVNKTSTTSSTSVSVAVTTTAATTCTPIYQIGTSLVHLATALPALGLPLTTQTVLLTIPDYMSNIQMYNCHPKPLSMPTMVTRRIGGSFILRNQRLERQRSEIQTAINSKRQMVTSPSYKTISVLNMHHKPNILKGTSKSSSKAQGIKRPSDKPISLESKQIRLTPDVNGFILHADVSETAEASQANNCLQEILAIFNMK